MSVDWRSLPSLSSLRAFEATAAEGGFSGAARALNVTHAAVAQQVRGLETHLGVRLVIRQGRGMALTETGQRLAEALTDGFGRISNGIEVVRDTEARRGLRITTTQFLVDQVILPHMPEFWEKHPGVEVAFFPARKFVDIAGEGFDCGIRVISSDQKPYWPELDSVFLARTSIVTVGSQALVGDGTGDPQKMPWLLHEDMAPKPDIMRSAGLNMDEIKWVDIGSALLQLHAVKQGMGLTLFNERIGRRLIEAGEIVEFPMKITATLDYYAMTPKGPRNALVDDFIGWVSELL